MNLSGQLRSLTKRMREATYSRERSALVQEAMPLIEKAADALSRKAEPTLLVHIDPDVAKLLGALGRGSQFPGREFYINNTIEFDSAVRALFARFNFEEVTGR